MLTLCSNCIQHTKISKFSFQTSTICSNRKCSKVVGTSSEIFGNVRKSSENSRKSSEVAGTLLTHLETSLFRSLPSLGERGVNIELCIN